MNKNDNYYNISVLFSVLFHFFLILILLFYQNKHKENMLKISMSLPSKSIEVDSVGLPNILKKDLVTTEVEKDVMHIPSKENILITKIKALKNIEDSLAKENYLKKIKIIKGLKLSPGKEVSSTKPEEKVKETTTTTSSQSSETVSTNDEELFKYIDTLKVYIKKYWSVPNWFYAEGLSAIISLTLKDDGGIKESKLYKSSGNDYFDNYAMKAIKDASPFPPPPKKLIEIADNDGLLITFP